MADAFREATAAHIERVRRALAANLTPEVVEDVQRFAERRASMVRDTGRPCPRLQDYARELVQDACTDTWLGDLAWDPDACSLAAHLKLAIKARTRTEIVKALRHVSIDAAANDNDDRPSAIAVMDPFASSGDLSAVRARALVAKMCDELEAATRSDNACLAVLRAWRRGLVDRDEILVFTSLDASAYARARKRLFYACSALPADLRHLVQDYLRST